MGIITGVLVRAGLHNLFNDQDASDDAIVDDMQRFTLEHYKSADDAMASTATTLSTTNVTRRACDLVAAWYMPNAALTHDASNYATITISKLNADGSTAVALGTIATSAGDWTAQVAVPVVLSVVAGALSMQALAAVRFGIAKTGTGVVVPAGRLILVCQPT